MHVGFILNNLIDLALLSKLKVKMFLVLCKSSGCNEIAAITADKLYSIIATFLLIRPTQGTGSAIESFTKKTFLGSGFCSFVQKLVENLFQSSSYRSTSSIKCCAIAHPSLNESKNQQAASFGRIIFISLYSTLLNSIAVNSTTIRLES